MSQFEDWNWAKFVSQHCSANIKTSAQGSNWKLSRGFSRNQVEYWGIEVVETREHNFLTARKTLFSIGSNRWNQDSFNWCLSEIITKIMASEKSKVALSWEQASSSINHLDYFVLKKHLLRKEKTSLCPLCIIYSKVNLCFCVCWR